MAEEKDERKGQDGLDAEWSGSMRKPWLNPPRQRGVGAGSGSWRWAMAVIILVVAVVIVILVLVGADVLPRGWAYGAIPFAIVGAALARVLTIYKAKSAGDEEA